MSVTLTTFVIEYVGDGSTRDFPVPFGFIEPEHMRVSVTASGTETWLTLGSEFTTSGENQGEGVGVVTITTAPPAGAAIRILRIVPITQLTEWRTQGPFSPVQWERALDLLTMICQQINGGAINIEDVFPGEVNGGVNVNTAGVGVYDGKQGVTLRFRGVKAGSAKISVTFDDPSNEIRVDLGTVGPADVGAAPASIVTTVNSHSSRITNLEARTRAVSARGEYKWDGSKYTLLAGSVDPGSILPASVNNFGGTTGRPQIIWKSALPENYRTDVMTSLGTNGMPAFASWSVKSGADLQMRFQTLDGEQNVSQFSLFVDYEGMEK